jgi:tRNA(Arg) A34 adenosine deaminase TadA
MKRSILNECLRIARGKHGPSHPAWGQKAVHYSFVVQDNKILEMGVNRPGASPPVHYGYPQYADIHSEIDAWRKARGILEDKEWEIVNIKLLKEPPLYPVADAAPCTHCEIMLIYLGCTNLYFTTASGGIAKVVW